MQIGHYAHTNTNTCPRKLMLLFCIPHMKSHTGRHTKHSTSLHTVVFLYVCVGEGYGMHMQQVETSKILCKVVILYFTYPLCKIYLLYIIFYILTYRNICNPLRKDRPFCTFLNSILLLTYFLQWTAKVSVFYENSFGVIVLDSWNSSKIDLCGK